MTLLDEAGICPRLFSSLPPCETAYSSTGNEKSEDPRQSTSPHYSIVTGLGSKVALAAEVESAFHRTIDAHVEGAVQCKCPQCPQVLP